MEQQLKCFALLPLKEIALRTVVVLSSMSEGCLKTKVNVKDILSKLGLPESLLKKALDLVKPIDFEINQFQNFHLENIDVIPKTKFCWTSVGAIDDRKTMENIVLSDMVDDERRYIIACEYCLKESIQRLWEELPKNRKAFYSRKKNLSPVLAFVWPHILSGKLSCMNHLLRKDDRILTSLYQWGFEYSVESCKKAAVEYFFHMLTFAERKDSLMRSAHALFESGALQNGFREYVDVAHRLLTLMTSEERREILQKHPAVVLMIFLNWPMQDLFVENATLLWTFLPSERYEVLIKYLTWGFGVHYLPKLFQELFIQSPLEFKQCFVGPKRRKFDCVFTTYFLPLFLKSNDSATIEVIFRNIDQADRVEIVFEEEVLFLFQKCILHDGWPIVKACLKEATLSEEDKKRWKEDFMYLCGHQIVRSDPKSEGFFEFFDEKDEQERGQKRNLVELLDDCLPE